MSENPDKVHFRFFNSKLLCLTLLIGIGASCRQSEKSFAEIIVHTFPIEKHLDASNLDIPISIKRLGIADSLLVITNDEDPYKIHIFNPLNNNLLTSFGRIGKGPNEFILEPLYYNQFQYDKDGLNLWLFDRNSRLLRLFNLNSIRANDEKAIKKSVLLSGGHVYSELSVYYISDSCIVGSSNISYGQFFIFNPIKDTIDYFNYFPREKTSKNEVKRETINNYFAGTGRLNPSGSKIAVAYLFFNRIDVFDIHEKRLLSIRNPSEGENQISDKHDISSFADNKFGYYSLYCSEKYIYALKNDCTRNNFTSGNYTSEIQVFDWSGLPICRYFLSHPIEFLVVDEKHKILYGGHYYTDGTISKFELGSELFEN